MREGDNPLPDPTPLARFAPSEVASPGLVKTPGDILSGYALDPPQCRDRSLVNNCSLEAWLVTRSYLLEDLLTAYLLILVLCTAYGYATLESRTVCHFCSINQGRGTDYNRSLHKLNELKWQTQAQGSDVVMTGQRHTDYRWDVNSYGLLCQTKTSWTTLWLSLSIRHCH